MNGNNKIVTRFTIFRPPGLLQGDLHGGPIVRHVDLITLKNYCESSDNFIVCTLVSKLTFKIFKKQIDVKKP